MAILADEAALPYYGLPLPNVGQLQNLLQLVLEKNFLPIEADSSLGLDLTGVRVCLASMLILP